VRRELVMRETRRLGAKKALTFCGVFMMERENKKEPHPKETANGRPGAGVARSGLPGANG
jgi:hypothetical protein